MFLSLVIFNYIFLVVLIVCLFKLLFTNLMSIKIQNKILFVLAMIIILMLITIAFVNANGAILYLEKLDTIKAKQDVLSIDEREFLENEIPKSELIKKAFVPELIALCIIPFIYLLSKKLDKITINKGYCNKEWDSFISNKANEKRK